MLNLFAPGCSLLWYKVELTKSHTHRPQHLFALAVRCCSRAIVVVRRLCTCSVRYLKLELVQERRQFSPCQHLLATPKRIQSRPVIQPTRAVQHQFVFVRRQLLPSEFQYKFLLLTAKICWRLVEPAINCAAKGSIRRELQLYVSSSLSFLQKTSNLFFSLLVQLHAG